MQHSDRDRHRQRECHLEDAAATRDLGRQLAAQLLAASATAPVLLMLQGDLGAGKTSLVQGLAEGLGIHESVTSPSFALAQHYGGQARDGRPTALVHLDLYRLDDSASADELFAQEEEEAQLLGAQLMAVEWPERLSSLPEGCWQLELALRDPSDPEAGRVAKLRLPWS